MTREDLELLKSGKANTFVYRTRDSYMRDNGDFNEFVNVETGIKIVDFNKKIIIDDGGTEHSFSDIVEVRGVKPNNLDTDNPFELSCGNEHNNEYTIIN